MEIKFCKKVRWCSCCSRKIAHNDIYADKVEQISLKIFGNKFNNKKFRQRQPLCKECLGIWALTYGDGINKIVALVKSWETILPVQKGTEEVEKEVKKQQIEQLPPTLNMKWD